MAGAIEATTTSETAVRVVPAAGTTSTRTWMGSGDAATLLFRIVLPGTLAVAFGCSWQGWVIHALSGDCTCNQSFLKIQHEQDSGGSSKRWSTEMLNAASSKLVP